MPKGCYRFGLALTIFQAAAISIFAGGLEFNTNRFGGDIRGFELDGGARACESACGADQRCRAFTWVKPGVQGARAHCWLKSSVPIATSDPNCISGVMASRGSSSGGRVPGTGAWGVWAYRIGADVDTWNACDIQYVAARRPARYDQAPNYRLVRNAESQVAADQFVSLFSRYHDDQPDFVVKMTTCNPDTRVVVNPPETTPIPPRRTTRPIQRTSLEYDVDRAGSDYRDFELDSGATGCQEVCATEAACVAFTWVKPGVQGKRARCWLKNAVPAPARNSSCISGVVYR